MTISNQGFKFKLYLEGVLTPFLGASLTYQNYVPTAVIDMFPSANFKNIKSGTLVHIFFKSLGVDEEYKLIFFGYVSGKSMQIQPDNRAYALTAFGRLGMLHSITLGTVLDYTGEGPTIKSLRHGAELSATEMQGGSGLAVLKSQSNMQKTITDNEVSPSLYFQKPDIIKQGVAGDSTSKEHMIQEKNDKASPAGALAAALSISNPDMLKQALLDIISDACNSSHEYYAIAYYHRYFIDKMLTELPPTWTAYIAAWDRKLKIRFTQAVDNMIAASLGGMSSLARLIDIILQFFFSEMREIPGLGIGACVIMPELMQSDIPACNMILPSERVTISISDDDANRITRIITHSHPYSMGANVPDNNRQSTTGSSTSTNKSINTLAAAIYPDVFSVAKDEVAGNGEIKTLVSYMLKNEEYIGSRVKTMPYPADYLYTHIDGVLQQNITEQIFYKFKNVHMNININAPFSPNLIPGFRAIIFDKHSPMIFKINGLAHRISNDGSAQTQIQGTDVEYFNENLTLRHPNWYDPVYKPDAIHELYKTYFGCTSMTESAGGAPGDLLAAYTEIYKKYDLSETKSYMAEILTKRKFDTETEIFALYEGNTIGQTHNIARDGSGVLIYHANAFDNYNFDGYDYNMQSVKLINDRQTPVINYIKTIYGIIGDIYE